ncbi:MAG TPA: phenylalanine--tRNA ligase subunit beta [Terriglobales bacterium]|jgi:phenylalanyl-tRNA synthetase beta chain
MKALLSWLREFTAIDGSPAALAERWSLAGLAVEQIAGDVVEFDLTSNRGDCLSHYGLAREIAAIAGGAELGAPERRTLARREAGEVVRILAPEACGLYCALRLEAVRVGPSARAMAARLEGLGQRAINNIADLTNYVLWEMGQPTHAFDFDKLRGGRIEVRWARAGEKLTTLDGVERALAADDLVIADAERPVALAGVMGGAETAISAATKTVLLESAWFDPQAVRRGARRHGLNTDASYRFERGADPAAAQPAAERIARLAAEAAQAAGEVLVARGTLPETREIPLRAAAIARTLGKDVEAAEADRLLTALGCEKTAAGWRAPSWRHDLAREIDLIEEVARLHGYDRFPARLPHFQGVARPLPEAGLRDKVRQQLRGRGFAEAVTLSFANQAACAHFAPQRKPVRVSNPLSEEAAILRTSSLPAMIEQLRYNLHRGVAAPRLFEIGKLYEWDGSAPSERWVLTLGATDAGLDYRSWRGEVEAVLGIFDVPDYAATDVSDERLNPAARLGEWAWLGQIQPDGLWVAEMALDRLYAAGARPIRYVPPPRFPASERDFSFLFADTVTWAQVEQALAKPAIAHLTSIAPAEVFRGQAVGEGHYSLLVRARFQSRERTLRDEEVQAGAEEIIRRLQRLGGKQR